MMTGHFNGTYNIRCAARALAVAAVALSLTTAAGTLSSCSRDASDYGVTPSRTRVLELDVSVRQDTRAAITGTDFPKDATIGLSVCKTGDYEPHTKGMDNIRATRTESGWNYSLSTNLNISTDVLAITSKAECNADVYAYAPWIEGVTNLEAIPYDAASQGDLMYAEENASGDANRNISPDPQTGDPAVDDSYPVHLRFRHALSLVRVGVRLANTGYRAPYMSYLTLRRTSGSVATRLYSGVTFNAISGTFTGGTYTETDEVTATVSNTYITSTTSYLYTNLLVIPTEVDASGELELLLGIDGCPLKDTYKIRLEDLDDLDGGGKGFRSGRSYTFLFTIDNYLRLVPDNLIISEWPDEEESLERYI